MLFAITAVDRYLGVFDAFVQAGWTPLKLFTVPYIDPLSNQQAVINYAEQHHADIQLSPITAHNLNELREQGCGALIVASYDWKICDTRPFIKYACNFHASPLPEGRGPYPNMQAILESRTSWAVTCHKLIPEIDRGDVLATEVFPMQSDECHESLDLKVQMAAKRLATKVALDFKELWNNAVPQESGSYWKKKTLKDRVLNFNNSVDSIMRHLRAFGATGSAAKVNNTWIIVKQGVGWLETHNCQIGEVVHIYNQTIVVAASNGYIGLIQNEIAPPHIVSELNQL